MAGRPHIDRAPVDRLRDVRRGDPCVDLDEAGDFV
jgi:hypothetical protein